MGDIPTAEPFARPRMSWTALVLGILLGVCVPVAAAQERPAPPPEAVSFYRSGREHFSAGRYREAVVDLERALTLDPGSPTLIYNLARVNELLGELDDAISYYNNYLQMLGPDDDQEREQVTETLGRLEGARANAPPAGGAARPRADDAEMDAPRFVRERGVADLPFWLTAGLGAALLVSGAVAGGLALDAESQAHTFVLGSSGAIEDRDAVANRADNLAVTADALLVAGLVAGVGAVLLYALRSQTVELYPSYDEPQPWLSSDGRSAVVGLRGGL